MGAYLGLDTSNYTTSAALYEPESGALRQSRLLLPVRPGELGLRQSDAVFHHTRQLPGRVEDTLSGFTGTISAVGASDRPTQAEGSYMPCFLSGAGAARSLGAALRVPVYAFSHQQGHIAAAALGAGRTDLLAGEFLAFHVSGGTTDALLVRPDGETVIACRQTAGSLDLKAGQLIDRVGGMLGLAFPAGPALETLALRESGMKMPRPTLRDGRCSLSGVENQCRRLLEQGKSPEQVARFCLLSVLAAVEAMTRALLERYPGRTVLYAGGVMSNSLLRDELSRRFDAVFAPPAFSSDNAAGIALLTALRAERSGPLCR